MVQVARVLLAVEKGRLHEFKGKNLDSIDVEGTLRHYELLKSQ